MYKPEKKPVTNLVYNEQVKLGAVFFNNLAVASFATGIIIPMVSLSAKSYLAFFIPWAIGAAFAIGLHLTAQLLLRHLKEPETPRMRRVDL
ncbi:hypothetical protein [Mesorhizobium sp. M0296]|uniref:hypothetical protein n=1 Tax=Mesorhizobium sp. M0296 TaxID=2956931 RepID=UPI003339DB61